MLGVDISDNNAVINWSQLAGTCQFVIIKATENDDYRNTMLAQQDGRARFYDMEVGYYHFAQPDKSSWALQAQHFARKLDGLRDDGNPLFLDVERGTGDLTDWVLQFTAAVETLCGRTVGLYSSPSFIAEHLRPVPELARLPLWLASWGVSSPVAPDPWREVTVWQDSDNWLAPGQTIVLDRDYFLGGGRLEFKRLGAGMTIADPQRIKTFLAETAVTLEGWAAEQRAGYADDRRRLEVAGQMVIRAAEARTLASS